MKTILITGVSGFLGQALALQLGASCHVIGMSRKAPNELGEITFVQGDFQKLEDLKKLDAYDIDAVVHLAASTGGCTEQECLNVNVVGTQTLMRYLIDQGVQKFVLASSSAAVGFAGIAFQPTAIPMPDEHPCLDSQGYGISKYLMEQLTYYYHRQNPQIEVINLRFGAVVKPGEKVVPCKSGPRVGWEFGCMSLVSLPDTLEAIVLSLESTPRSGVHVYNVVGPESSVENSVVEILDNWFPDKPFDLSYYKQAGNEKAAVFDMQKIKHELGFVPQHVCKPS